MAPAISRTPNVARGQECPREWAPSPRGLTTRGAPTPSQGWLSACSLQNFPNPAPEAAAGGRATKVTARMSHTRSPREVTARPLPTPGDRPARVGRTGKAAQGPSRRDPGSGLGPSAAIHPAGSRPDLGAAGGRPRGPPRSAQDGPGPGPASSAESRPLTPRSGGAGRREAGGPPAAATPQ